MKMNLRNAFKYTLFWLSLLLAWRGQYAIAGDRDLINLAGYIPVQYCELVQHWNEYDGKNVAIRASYRYGFEWREIFGMKCLEQITWAEFEPESDSAEKSIDRAMRKIPRQQGTINATFYGTFKGTKGHRYGHLGGYAFGFDVKFIEDVEVVSKDDLIPPKLSVKEQNKLCQGNEQPKTVGK
jgi:hypothetical protein